MTHTKNDQNVHIILEESSHARRFEVGTLIHSDEYLQATTFINKLIPQELEDKASNYLHNTITIFGTRGSGKTSFLLSLLEAYKKHPKIMILDIIDPTLIEDKGHVFLNVIAAIKEKVSDVLNIDPPTEESRNSQRKWREELMRLAAGLPSIDGLGSYNTDRWQDPEYVLDTGLSAVGAALNLAKNFDSFLQYSLKILGKTSFLLTFDDIDVDATKGWAVLETIRKYFTTSRLITLLSGDLKLYSMVVRQKKWSNFGAEILKYEGQQENKLPQFNNMVTELESQYLQKIMQPKYRIHLLSLLEKKRIGRLPNIFVSTYADQQTSDELIILYGQIFQNFGIHNSGQSEVFMTFIFSQPLRTQIQFASIMSACLRTRNQRNEKLIGQNREQITDIFLADLLEHGIDVNLANSTTKYLNTIVLDLLLRTGQLKDLYQLQPSTTNNSLNACLISLNMLLAKSFQEQNIFLAFDYQIKIGYIRNLLEILPLKSDGVNQPSITDLCEKTGLLNDSVLRDLTGKINAYLLGFQDPKGSNRPITTSYINLLGLNGPANRITTNRLDYIFQDDGSAASILGFLPSYSASYSYKNSSTVSYSIYMVIASIGELLKVYETRTDDQNIHDSLKSTLKELSQHRVYSAPDFRRGENIPEQFSKEGFGEEQQNRGADNLETTNSNTEIQLFAEELVNWMKLSHKAPDIAIHLLGKISTRTYFAIQNIIERKPSSMLLGELFHYQIVALMNAILIEDIRENMSDSSHLNISNTNFSEKILINNLQQTMVNSQYEKSGTSLGFSKWLLACPILRGYIKNEPSSSLRNVLADYCGNVPFQENFGFSISHRLDKVAIQGSNQNPNDQNLTNNDEEYSILSKPGNEIELIKVIKKLSGGTDPLKLSENIGITGRRNKELKRILPDLFPNDKYYTDRVNKLRKRLNKMGLT